MSKDSRRQAINIRFEIDIPVGFTVNVNHSISAKEDPTLPSRASRILSATTVSLDFSDGDTIVVKQVSGTALGKLCTVATFDGNVYDVHGNIYSGSSPTIPASPDASSVLGAPNGDNSVWTWNDSNSIPGADNTATPSYPVNTVVIWWKNNANDPTYQLSSFQFHGQTGTTGPCGSGSGPEISQHALRRTVAQYPVLWSLEMQGFEDTFVDLNARHVLKGRRTHESAIWEGRPHETGTKIELIYSLQLQEWLLMLSNGNEKMTLRCHSNSAFGPLFFNGSNKPCGRPGPQAVATAIKQ